jgi:4-hydroxybenzoate polyprenyltransferase
VASFGYVVNDLLDLQSDRAHPTKQFRPFASGDLTVRHGIAIGAVLLLLAGLACSVLPASAGLALLCYLALTISYSVYLKTKLMIDVVALGALFTLRVIGGAEAIQTELSFYLMSFSIFLFASLGMVKRYGELLNLQKRNKLAAKGRGYHVDDMAPVRIIGISMGYMSVFILGQYINSPVVTKYYSNPKFIWLLFPLLMFWLGRLWILANRGEVNEDPLVFTVKDRTSQLIFATAAVILLLAN